MRKTRKGFTLVELLIVVAILAALAATMTVAMSGSTAKAKAASIVTNVDACVKAVQEYYYAEVNGNPTANATTAEYYMLSVIPRWESFKTGNINYTLENKSSTAVKDWVLKVDFTGDTDSDNIAAAVTAVRGFDKFYTYTAATQTAPAQKESWTLNSSFSLSTTKKFNVRLWNGKIEASS